MVAGSPCLMLNLMVTNSGDQRFSENSPGWE